MSSGRARLRLQSGACCTSPLPCFGSRKKPTRPVQNKNCASVESTTQKLCNEKLVTEYLLKNFYGMHLIGENLTGIMGIKNYPYPDHSGFGLGSGPSLDPNCMVSNIFYDIGGEFALQQICRYKFGFSLFPGAEAIYHH